MNAEDRLNSIARELNLTGAQLGLTYAPDVAWRIERIATGVGYRWCVVANDGTPNVGYILGDSAEEAEESIRRIAGAHVVPSMIVADSPDIDGRAGIGYWRGGFDNPDSLPHPVDYIDPSWDLIERMKVADALDRAPVLASWRGMSRCRICDKFNGSQTFGYEDGPVWPSGFSHYVRDHAVRPPAEFVAWLLSK